MAKALQAIITKFPAGNTVTIDLDQADRRVIVAVACAQLYGLGNRAYDIVEWKQRASAWSMPELIHRASELGVRFVQGRRPYELPVQIRRR